MKILFHDVIQNSDAHPSLKSPALSDIYTLRTTNEITLEKASPINAIGIGNLQWNSLSVELIDENDISYHFSINSFLTGKMIYYPCSGPDLFFPFSIGAAPAAEADVQIRNVFLENGLYILQEKPIITKKIIFSSLAPTIGRLAAGTYTKLCTSMAKEPGLMSTHQPRKTLAGQIIPGAGGYTYWRMSLDVRYKIGKAAMDEIIAGYRCQIGKGFPLFVEFEEEQKRLPIKRMYATDTNQTQMTFESQTAWYLFSRRFIFEEAF